MMPNAYEMVRAAGGFGTTECIAELEAEILRLRALIEKQREATYRDSEEIGRLRTLWHHAGDRIRTALDMLYDDDNSLEDIRESAISALRGDGQ